jgi:hypothetical protein
MAFAGTLRARPGSRIGDSRSVGRCVKGEGELLNHGTVESERGKAGWRLDFYG